MNIVVLGAGAVGGYFGGKLAAKGSNVTFLVRPKRYKQLQKNGLHVKSVAGDFSITPNVVFEASEIDKPDLVIVALKNYHLEEALPQIETLVNNGAKVLPLLNGIKHLDVLTSKFGQEKVLGGLCYIEATLNNESEIVHTSALHEIVFGPLLDTDRIFLRNLKDRFEQAKVPVTLSETILEDMWKKYIFLTSLSGITTATRQPIGVALQDDVTANFLNNVVTEVYEIAQARNILLPENTIEAILTKLHSLSPEMTSSMHRDLEKGLSIELDSLHGYLLTLAEKYQIEVPSIHAIYSLLHPYKNGMKNEKDS
ncbi:ketopantoate reductase family protein [Halalkalibacter alkalisediminis]|uniref:2-dehydropantoate 2-reductase n=1 Tax=Halalkalibacter alkalisediminis TaxID=935616 RepID=A0ABV6NGY9_9BACI|nr:ketopantoate reductase family protein [Halalkalibacter alkalisediminis]